MSYDYLFEEGLRLLNQKEFLKAYEKFALVVKQNSHYAEAYVAMGLCLEKMGKLQEATKLYKQALQNDPKNVTAIYNLGVVYLGLNKNFKAWYQFKKTLSLQPSNPQALHNLGLIYYNKKRYNWAISCLQQAVETSKEKPHAIHYLLAKAFQAQGRDTEAFYHLYKSLQYAEDFLPALLELLKLYQKKNEWLKFFEIVKKIYQLCPDNQVLYGEILNSLQTIKENNLNLNGIDNRQLENLISEFKTELNPQIKSSTRSRIRDMHPRVIISEPDENTPRVYH